MVQAVVQVIVVQVIKGRRITFLRTPFTVLTFLCLVGLWACAPMGHNDSGWTQGVAGSSAQVDPRHRAISRHTSAAAMSLIETSVRNESGGNLVMASANVERALRISPRSPLAYRRLAEVRLTQQRLPAAEQMARKALALAGDASALPPQARLAVNEFKISVWQVIMEVARLQGNEIGVEKAVAMIDRLRQ